MDLPVSFSPLRETMRRSSSAAHLQHDEMHPHTQLSAQHQHHDKEPSPWTEGKCAVVASPRCGATGRLHLKSAARSPLLDSFKNPTSPERRLARHQHSETSVGMWTSSSAAAQGQPCEEHASFAAHQGAKASGGQCGRSIGNAENAMPSGCDKKQQGEAPSKVHAAVCSADRAAAAMGDVACPAEEESVTHDAQPCSIAGEDVVKAKVDSTPKATPRIAKGLCRAQLSGSGDNGSRHVNASAHGAMVLGVSGNGELYTQIHEDGTRSPVPTPLKQLVNRNLFG